MVPKQQPVMIQVDNQNRGLICDPTAMMSTKQIKDCNRNLLASQNKVNVTRGTLLGGILEAKFHGASGIVDFGKEVGKERNTETIAIGIYNIRPGNVTSFGKQSFYATLVLSRNDSEWVQLKNEAIVFRYGSTVPPKIGRAFVENNYLSPGVRTIGLVLMGISWLLGLAALVGLQIYSKDAVVQRAQPFFLKMLCYGSILTSSAIFTLSWDEGAGWSDRQLDIACAMTPWFFFVGIILTFCALFTKLWRVDKVLQFKRRAVTISNVMKPWYVVGH
jgi:7 transmembrane sweet-taste receptor of 3 GCPR